MRWQIDSGSDVITLAPVRPETQIGWWLTSMEGWDGTPAPREDSVDRIGLDGAHAPLRLTQGPRTITLGGAAGCASSVEAGILANRIAGLFGRELTVSRVDPLGVMFARGLLYDDPQPQWHADERVLAFSLVIHCDDPHKYGPPAYFPVVNGRAVVENPGTAPAWPVLHADNPGGLDEVRVSDGMGHEITWQGGDGIGSLVLDFASLAPAAGVVMRDSAIPIQPGSTLLYVTATAGSTLTVECSPAWR